MAQQIPTTQEIQELIISQIEAAINQTIPLLPKAFVRVLAKALAGVCILLYKYGGFIFLQIFVSAATIDETTINGRILSPLIEWGRLIGAGDPVPATQARLLIDITVDNQGGTLDAGAQLVSNKNGVTYITDVAVLLNAATVQAEILAVNDQVGGGGAGVIGNLDPGDVVSFANPLPDVARDAVVNSQIVTGADGESTDAYRQRVVDRFQKRPQGGAYADYELWGEEVAGIIGIFPYTGNPGEVNVYAEATVASSGNPDGIPTAAQLVAVKDSIEFDETGRATRRPVTAFVTVFPITRRGFEVTIIGLQVDNEAEVQAQIDDLLDSYFLDRAPFIDGLTVPPRKDTVSLNSVIGIIDDVVSSRNGTFANVTLVFTGTTTSVDRYSLAEGEKSKLDQVTYL